jgi:hypothetical protein
MDMLIETGIEKRRIAQLMGYHFLDKQHFINSKKIVQIYLEIDLIEK